jgi:hypothetical protein
MRVARHPLCAAEDNQKISGGLGEHCSSPEHSEVELRSPAFFWLLRERQRRGKPGAISLAHLSWQDQKRCAVAGLPPAILFRS